MPLLNALLRVHGKVQGVFFRAFVCRQAASLGVKGWVANESDGTVLIRCWCRDYDHLMRFRNGLLMHTTGAFVDRIEEEGRKYDDSSPPDFSIRE